MTAIVIDGKKIANSILEEVSNDVKKFKVVPTLAVVLVGNDPASEIYVERKMKVCKEVGIYGKVFTFASNISQHGLEKIIAQLNNDFDGILIQLPLPEHINKQKVLNLVDPEKDVDGFNAVNIGKLAQGIAILKPCTPLGVIEILKNYDIPTQGKQVTIINRSQVVGQPLALMLQQEPFNATVTTCHEHTTNLVEHVENSDIVVTAVGKYPNFQFPEFAIKRDAAVIDVAINRINGKLCGDVVNFEQAKKMAKWITPVPGCVGLTTVACLMRNTLLAKLNRRK